MVCSAKENVNYYQVRMQEDANVGRGGGGRGGGGSCNSVKSRILKVKCTVV